MSLRRPREGNARTRVLLLLLFLSVLTPTSPRAELIRIYPAADAYTCYGHCNTNYGSLVCVERLRSGPRSVLPSG
jgi:hypothetical protein